MDRTLSLLRERIANSEFYEAHQSIRTVVARYVRKRNFTEAIGLLYASCLILTDAMQFGSAIDLLAYLLDVYMKSNTLCNGETKGRIATVLFKLQPSDPGIKQLEKPIDQWVNQANPKLANGDPDLHHVFGLIYYTAGNPYDAERHLLRGIKESALILARLHCEWYNTKREHAALYFSRGVLPLICLERFTFLESYIQAVVAQMQVDLGGVINSNILIIESQPLVGFLQLLAQCCLRRDARIYNELVQHYDPKQFDAWQPSLTYIEAEFFNIRPRKQLDLAELMGSMFG